jgi:hypothetical protein
MIADLQRSQRLACVGSELWHQWVSEMRECVTVHASVHASSCSSNLVLPVNSFHRLLFICKPSRGSSRSSSCSLDSDNSIPTLSFVVDATTHTATLASMASTLICKSSCHRRWSPLVESRRNDNNDYFLVESSRRSNDNCHFFVEWRALKFGGCFSDDPFEKKDPLTRNVHISKGPVSFDSVLKKKKCTLQACGMPNWRGQSGAAAVAALMLKFKPACSFRNIYLILQNPSESTNQSDWVGRTCNNVITSHHVADLTSKSRLSDHTWPVNNNLGLLS